MAEATITTTATGRTRAPPERAELEFRTQAIEDDVTSARRAVAEQAADLRTALAGTGVPEENVRTVRFRVDRRGRHRGDQPDDDRPYEAVERVGVTVDDLDALGAVLETAVDDAGAEIHDVTFTFRTETKRELEREALADAVTTARRKAEAAASAEGLAVGDVHSMTTEGGSRARRSAAMLSAEATQESGTPPATGPLDVSVGVEVEYGLQDAD